MSKVLFIEDELTANIPALQKYFQPLLESRNLLGQLKGLESKPSLQNSDVVNVCNKASELDLVYKFPVALTKIVHRYRDYDLIIVDRDLSSYDYSGAWDKIKADLDFVGLLEPEDKPSDFKGKEGDLLLLILLRLDQSNKDKIFFLVSGSKDVVKSSEQLETIIDLAHFSPGRILTKGAEAEQVISVIFADLPAFTLQNRYKEQCDILRRRYSDREDEVNEFIEIAKLSSDLELKIDFLQKLRPLTEKLLVSLAERIGNYKDRYWKHFHDEPSLQYKDFINELDRLDHQYHLGYNKNIRQCLYSLWQIPSDFASHTSGNPDDITIYSITALFNQLCDTILWFDRAMGSLSNKKK
jgi:hypothetical protein